MSLLIIYSSKYGSTEKSAKNLGKFYGKNFSLLNIKNRKKQDIDLEKYDSIAIGGSIYVGKIHREIKRFCSDYEKELLKKKIGLFLCCGSENELNKYFKDSFGTKLLPHSVYNAHFGYEYDFDKMSFLSRVAVKKIAGINKSKSNILKDNIKKMAKKLE